VALNEGGGGEWGGYEGERHLEKGTFWNLGKGGHLRAEDIFWFGVWVNCCRGHQVAGIFGLGGQESSRNPGAREPDRLCS
jgi:hypothetical protein